MHFILDSFWLAKAGNEAAEYEDAFWPEGPVRGHAPTLRLAVGDGATEASFASAWARILVRDYATGRFDAANLPERLPQLRRRWERHVLRKPMPWYAEEKARDGAFASIMGLTLEDPAPLSGRAGAWSAMAVGDSCLFQVRDSTLVASFPLGRADQFDNRPMLVASVAAHDGNLRDAIRRESGTWAVGDTFYLMTDALACWFLADFERSGEPPRELLEVGSSAQFAAWIAARSSNGTGGELAGLRNDDVTLMRCTILDSKPTMT